MNYIVKLLSSLPLAGTAVIRPALFNLYSCTTRRELQSKYLKFFTLIMTSFIIHSGQVTLGYFVVIQNQNNWIKSYGVVYALINVAVVVTHGHLLRRAKQYVAKGILRTKKRNFKDYSTSYLVYIALATLCGQLIVILSL